MKSLMAVNTLGVVLVNDEKEKQAIQLRRAAVKAKRKFALAKKQERIDSLPEAPVMLTLSELQRKTQMPFQLLRKMVVEEHKISYIKVGSKYLINYDSFLELLRGDKDG
jgi:hypothetical protein